MKSLHPTIWRTCRVLANEVRLKMLWRLFQQRRSSMGELAAWGGISEATASKGLRSLNARGLIRAERIGKNVYYAPEANPEVEHAESILTALKKGYEQVVPYEHVIHVVTAFTHPRRVEILIVLSERSFDVPELSIRTQISVPALQRHLRKLI